MTRTRRTAARIYAAGAAAAVLTFLFTDTLFKNETLWDDAFAGAFVAILVIGFMYQKELARREVEKQRFDAFRATMVTVQDILGNFLTSVQLVHMEYEGVLPPESLQLFEQLVNQASAHLKALGDLDRLETKPMAIGSGIKYPEPVLPSPHIPETFHHRHQ
jgi:hypothetical protein